MKKGLAAAVFLMLMAGPAQAGATHTMDTRAEQAALAELLSARIRAALDGEAYVLDKACDDESADCTISIRP